MIQIPAFWHGVIKELISMTFGIIAWELGKDIARIINKNK